MPWKKKNMYIKTLLKRWINEVHFFALYIYTWKISIKTKNPELNGIYLSYYNENYKIDLHGQISSHTKIEGEPKVR